MPPLISTQSVTKSFGARPLFTGISLAVDASERIGLIGANGSGKSTLLRILAGLEAADSGEVARKRGLKTGYVAQDDRFTAGLTVDDALEQAISELPYDDIERSTRIAVMLGQVGFADASQPADLLSGGWRKRLAIAVALIKEPDLLLLDEPTNHLDVEGIVWLEKLLATLPISCIMVSHDRYFLERTVTRIVELGRQYSEGFITFAGVYSDFLTKREEFLAAQSRHEDTLAAQVRKEIEWLRRGPPARTTKAKYRIDEAGAMMENLADLRDRNARESVGKMDFAASGRKTRELIVAKNITLSPGGIDLISGLDLTLSPKMRLGILGRNGSGKTTLLRTLAGEREPEAGTIKRAERVKVVYFSQDRREAPREISLRRALAGDSDTVVYNGQAMHVSGWAKRFLFRSEQLDVSVDRLSGGEQARLLIARLMLDPADVLILDEPTNDLDIPTLDVLEESLLEFPGALVLVTHDRYILDRVSTELLVLDVDGASRYFADYYQWESVTGGFAGHAPLEVVPVKVKQTAQSEPAAKPKMFRGLTRPEQRELDRMEDAISSAERTLADMELQMTTREIASDYIKLQELLASCESQRTVIEALYTRWQELEGKSESGGS